MITLDRRLSYGSCEMGIHSSIERFRNHILLTLYRYLHYCTDQYEEEKNLNCMNIFVIASATSRLPLYEKWFDNYLISDCRFDSSTIHKKDKDNVSDSGDDRPIRVLALTSTWWWFGGLFV